MTPTRTKLTATVVVIALIALVLSSNGFIPGPQIDTFDLRTRIAPSTADGTWVQVIATWEAPGAADIVITASSSAVPPACTTGRCPTNPYKTRIQVRRGDTVHLKVHALGLWGRATCVLKAPLERNDEPRPPARNEVKSGGAVECVRLVDWSPGDRRH